VIQLSGLSVPRGGLGACHLDFDPELRSLAESDLEFQTYELNTIWEQRRKCLSSRSRVPVTRLVKHLSKEYSSLCSGRLYEFGVDAGEGLRHGQPPFASFDRAPGAPRPGGVGAIPAAFLSYRELRMALELTAVFRRVPEGYVAFVEELPGANTQGATLDEARANLREAVELTLEANRALAEEDLAGADVIREPLKLTA
jgi:predicted RNase H-like HicB family nuclease